MKLTNLIFTLSLAVVCSLGLKGQEYVPFPTDSAQWHIYYAFGHESGYPHPLDTLLLRYALHGDTIMLDSVEYNILYIETGDTLNPQKHIAGGLREEDKKIYYRYLGSISTSSGYLDSLSVFYGVVGPEEILLYDFSAAIGDTIKHDESFLSSLILDIDSVPIHGEYRKRYKVKPLGQCYHSPEYYIEGIGSVISGLLGVIYLPRPEYPGFDNDYAEHVCFKERGVVKYVNPAYSSCYPEQLYAGVHLPITHPDLSIFPNPASDQLSIVMDCLEHKPVVSLFNTLGVLVFQQQAPGGTESFTVDVSSFPAGLYVVEVLCGDGRYVEQVVITWEL